MAERWRNGLVEGSVYWIQVRVGGELKKVKATFVGMRPVKVDGETSEWPGWRGEDGEEFIAAGAMRECDIALGNPLASADRFVLVTRETYREEVEALRASLVA